jgi:phospholipase/carboxylesterase
VISGPARAPLSGGPPKQLIVLLHGYGADGEDLIGLAEPLGEQLPDAFFVAPNAPSRCGQNPFGYEWFPLDFVQMQESVRIGTPAARQVVVDYLSDAWARSGLGPSETFLCGFSQGAMMALHVGLSLPKPPLGVVSFSGALVPPEGFGSPDLPKPPVCLVHGELDEVVIPARTREAAAVLEAAGYDVSVHFSPGLPHGISMDGLDFAAGFMRRRLAAATD